VNPFASEFAAGQARKDNGFVLPGLLQVSERKSDGLFISAWVLNKVLTFMGQVGIIETKFARRRGLALGVGMVE
jgi:hypothetical protein